MIDCREARLSLDGAAGPTRAALETTEARRHLNDCSGCRAWLESEREWRAALQEKLPTPQAPLHVKERLFAALAGGRVRTELRRQRRRFLTAAVLAGIVCVGLAAAWLWRERSRDGLLLAALTEDHLLYASRAEPAEFASSDPDEVARWLAGRVDFGIWVPRLAGATLIGGRLCTLADRRAALSIYQRNGRRLSLFQMPAAGLPIGSLHPMQADGRLFRCGHRKGLSLIAWVDRDVLFALVSDLSQADMVRLAPGSGRG